MHKLEAIMRQRAERAPRVAVWEKLPSVEGAVYCNCCGGGRDKSNEDFVVAVGFGSACVTANGHLIVDEQEWIDGQYGEDADVTLSLVERIATTRPDADWRIAMHGPLSGQEYQRHDAGQWALVHRDEGFA